MPLIAYAIIAMIVSYAINIAMMPRPKDAEAAKQDEFDFPQTEEGTPQSVVFGDAWIKDWTVLDINNFRTTAIESSGGKK